MIDYFLKFQDEQEANSTLYGEDGTPLAAAIDIIGTIWKPTGVMLTAEDGSEVSETAPIEGFHVNVRTPEPVEALEPFRVDPEPITPVRVWA